MKSDIKKIYKHKLIVLMFFILCGMIVHKSAEAVTHKATSDEAISQGTPGGNEILIRPILDQIHFSGNTTISSKELISAIPLKVNNTANENMIISSMVKIAQLYKTKNIKVTITPVIAKILNNHTTIRFDIHEQLVK